MRTTVWRLGLLAVAVAGGSCGGGSPQTGTTPIGQPTEVQVGHLLPGFGPVDVFVDQTLLVQNVSYGAFSAAAAIDSGSRHFRVLPAGVGASGAAFFDKTFDVPVGARSTLVLFGPTTDPDLLLLQQSTDRDPLHARVRIVNTLPDRGSAIDAFAAGTKLVENLSFGSAGSFQPLSPATTDIRVARAGGADLFTARGLTLEADKTYSLFAAGDGSSGAPFQLVGLVEADGPFRDKEGTIAFVNGMPDSGPVDVWVDGQLVFEKRDLGQQTPRLALTAGSYTLFLRKAGSPATSTPLASQTFAFSPGDNLTFAVGRKVANATIAVFSEDLTPPPAGKAKVEVINLMVEESPVDVTVFNGLPLFHALPFLQMSGFAQVDPGMQFLLITETGKTPLATPQISPKDQEIVSVVLFGSAISTPTIGTQVTTSSAQ